MNPSVSDSQNPIPDPSPEDDWGDAVQLVNDGNNGSSVLPPRREFTEQTIVTIIEGDEAPHVDQAAGDDAAYDAAYDEDYSPSPLGKGKIRVREIIGRKVKRLRPEKPEVEKVARKEASFEKAKKERWEIEAKEWARIQTFQIKWVLGIAAAVVVLILICLAMLPYINKGSQIVSKKEDVLQIMDAPTEARDIEMEDLLLRHDEAKDMFCRFASAHVVEEVLPMLRNPKVIEPLIREAGHTALAPKQWQVGRNTEWSLHLLGGRAYACLKGRLPDFTKFHAYFILQGGELQIDWKATTGYCSANYEELEQGEGDASEIRGTITPASLYTMAFPEDEYQCFQLSSPDEVDMIWCYTEKNTEVAIEFAKLFMGGGIVQKQIVPVHVTLKLARGPEGSLKNQWLIEELVHEQWIEF